VQAVVVIVEALAVGVKVGVSSGGKVAVGSSAGFAVSVGVASAPGGETGRMSPGSGTFVGARASVADCKTAWVAVTISAVSEVVFAGRTAWVSIVSQTRPPNAVKTSRMQNPTSHFLRIPLENP
jgi:hypothetical protein